MPKPRSRTRQLTPISSSNPAEPPPNTPLFRLTILGSSRHLLNWRAIDFRKVERTEAEAFLRAHPGRVTEPPVVDPGNWYPYRNLWEGPTLALKRFSISADNQVTVLPWGQEPAPSSLVISSLFDLVRASHRWRPTRYVRIWNSLPGVEPVRSFPCRLTAMNSIWYRIQSLEAITTDPERALPGTIDGPGGEVIDSCAGSEKEVANDASKRDSCRDRNLREEEGNEMKRFSIDANHRVTVLAGDEPAAAHSALFDSAEELGAIAAHWPMKRLVEIWNGLTGVEPVRKFKDRATGVSRIWAEIQAWEAPATTRPVRKARKEVTTKASQPVPPVAVSPATKKDQVLAMLRSTEGATLSQLMAATGWQKHSVRGFLSGALHKKMGLTVLSFKNAAGERAYRLKR